MPSLITHHIFAEEVFKKTNKDIQSKFKDELTLYQTFAQSHDYLFYYKTLNIPKTHEINFLGKIGHRRNTQDYLLNLINIILEFNLKNYQPVIAYLYGSITHYVLDSTCHPLIFYKTGIYDPRKKLKEHKKYKGLHAYFERNLDCYYYKKYYKKDFKGCNISKDIIKKPNINIDLVNIINMTYKRTYNVENTGIYYKQSIKSAKRIYSLFINDKHTIKNRIYKYIDKISHNHFGYLSCFPTSNKVDTSLFNLEHNTWNHPCTKEETYTYSIEDLYDISIKKCLKIFEEVYKVLYEKQDIDKLKKYIPNISYSTGLELDKNKRMQYFEF